MERVDEPKADAKRLPKAPVGIQELDAVLTEIFPTGDPL
jgi:hypothetical protein